MSTDAVSEKKGLLHELKDEFSIDLTEEEYLAKEAEIRKIADKLTINMDVLNLLDLQAASSRPFHYILFRIQGSNRRRTS